MIFIVFHRCSFFGNNKKSCPISKTINITLDVASFLKIIKQKRCQNVGFSNILKTGDPHLATTARLFLKCCCGSKEEKKME